MQEIERAVAKWGTQHDLSNAEWHCILTEEVGEAAREILDNNTQLLRIEMTQVACVALAHLSKLELECL